MGRSSDRRYIQNILNEFIASEISFESGQAAGPNPQNNNNNNNNNIGYNKQKRETEQTEIRTSRPLAG
jgi:hypothetical protein